LSTDSKLWSFAHNELGQIRASYSTILILAEITAISSLLLSGVHLGPTFTPSDIPRPLPLIADNRSADAEQPNNASERAFANANKLRSAWNEQSLRAAIAEYSESQRLSVADGNRRQEANALKAIGELYFILGQSEAARRAYVAGLSISRKLGDRRLEADLLNALGEAELDEKGASVARRFESARSISEAEGYSLGMARALTLLAITDSMLNRLFQALDHLNQSLSLFSSEGDLLGQADALTNIGYITSDLGETRKALDYFARAADKAAQGGDPRRRAIAQAGMGLMLTALGELEAARDSHRTAVSALTTIGDRISLAAALNSQGYLSQELGEPRYALSCYENSLNIARQSRQLWRQGISFGLIGRLYESYGDRKTALTYYRKRLLNSFASRDKRQQAYSLADVGSIYSSMGQRRKAISYYKHSIIIGRGLNHPRVLAFATNNLARAYYSTGNYGKAGKLYEKALKLTAASGDRHATKVVIHGIAELKRDEGDLDGALTEAQKLVGMIESERSSVASADLRASYFASAYANYELYVDLLMRKHERKLGGGFDVLAFEQADKGRARSLTDVLAQGGSNITEGVDSELVKSERDLRLLLDAKANQQMGLLKERYEIANATRTQKTLADGRTTAAQLDEAISNLDAEIDDTKRKLRNVEADIEMVSPRYSALQFPKGLSLEDVQRKLLDSDTIAFEYSLGEQRSYLWVVSDHDFVSFILPGRRKIEKAAALLIQELSRDPRSELSGSETRALKMAGQLSKLVFPAALSQIDLKGKRLVVVADGALQYIPFGVLLNPGEQTFLSERNEVISLPSLSALAEVRKAISQRTTAPHLLAMFADPVFEADDPRMGQPQAGSQAARPSDTSRSRPSSGTSMFESQPDFQTAPAFARAGLDSPKIGKEATFHRLLFARQEADEITKITGTQDVKSMLGFEATKSVAKTMDLSQYRIIHFATHSLLDFKHPELSCIVLSQRDPFNVEQDGFLRLADIYNIKLSADLVVLSACQTAVGRNLRGEGLVSLTRGFMYGGAARVVASMWRIDDEASKELMAKFYDHMLGQDHMTPAAALRAAQNDIRKHDRWRHPYFWAAFVMQGEWR
jgi:CHAT domain-containing protein